MVSQMNSTSWSIRPHKSIHPHDGSHDQSYVKSKVSAGLSVSIFTIFVEAKMALPY